MRVQFPSRSAVNFYDRIDSWVVQTYGSTAVEPHAEEERISYTVPDGRLLYVQHLYVYMTRSALATTPGRFIAHVSLWIGIAPYREIARVWGVTNQLYDGIQFQLSQPLILRPGNEIKVSTADYSTGGGSDIRIALLGFTFYPG